MAEAVFVATIIASTVVGKAKMDEYIDQQNDATALGVQLTSTLSAIDKRIFLDGYYSSTVWDKVYPDAISLSNDLFKKELIAKNNPTCGDAFGGWAPSISVNDELALLPCGFFNPTLIPLGFEISGFRKGDNAEVTKIGSWGLELHHSDPDKFSKYFKSYSRIINTIKQRKGVRITGDFSAYLVQVGTDSKIDYLKCEALSTNCAIRVEYTPHADSAFSAENIRVDGSAYLRKDLSFRTGSTKAECFKMDGLNQVVTNCGIEVDGASVNANVMTLTVESLIAAADGGAPTDSLCQGKDGALTSCGISVLSTNSSVYSQLLTGTLYLEDQLKVYSDRDGADPKKDVVLSVDKKGDVSIKYNLGVESDITTSGSLKATNGVNTTNLNIGKDAWITGDAVAEALGGAVPPLETFGKLPNSCEGSSMTTNSSGTIFQCVNSNWLKVDYPSQAVLPFKTACPDGWTPLVIPAGYRVKATDDPRKIGLVTNKPITTKLTERNIPAHTHKWGRYSMSSAKRKHKSPRRVRLRGTFNTTPNNNVSSSSVNFRSQTMAVNFCKKG